MKGDEGEKRRRKKTNLDTISKNHTRVGNFAK
jgi:hypothetical protein